MARTITDMLLAKTDQNSQRFYSMSAQIRNERRAYYNILEKTQKGTLDITEWLEWFLTCLDSSLSATEETLAKVMRKFKLSENLKAYSLNDRQQKMLNALIDGFGGKLTSSKNQNLTGYSFQRNTGPY